MCACVCSTSTDWKSHTRRANALDILRPKQIDKTKTHFFVQFYFILLFCILRKSFHSSVAHTAHMCICVGALIHCKCISNLIHVDFSRAHIFPIGFVCADLQCFMFPFIEWIGGCWISILAGFTCMQVDTAVSHSLAVCVRACVCAWMKLPKE